MYKNIELNQAALKRGFSERDISWAFTYYLYDGPMEEMENKYLRIGFTPTGVLLEIMYNEIDDFSVNVFHVMRCRSIYYHLLNL
ncbi:MAG: hypothetical protein FWD28_08430 [Treponema sp.]|nr:hypothetical protein [Treponema sp.]